MSSTRPPVPHRLATLVATVLVPAIVVTIGVALMLAARNELPDPIATHWGADGADGTGSLTSQIIMLALIATLLCGLMAFVGLKLGYAAVNRRFAAGVAVWASLFMTGLITWSTLSQRGLSDALDSTLSATTGLIVFAGALVAAVIAAFLMPGDAPLPASAPVPSGAPKVSLAPGDVAGWVQQVSMPNAGWFVAAVSAVLGGALALSGDYVIAAIAAALVALLLFSMSVWTISVGLDGLSARSLARFPRIHVPAGEVEEASVGNVRVFKEFGGFGIRINAAGTTGVVLRSGTAIRVARTGGRDLVVTVDDAETGAALLNTYAAAARAQ